MHDLSDTFFGLDDTVDDTADTIIATEKFKPEKTFYQSWYDLIFFVSSFVSALVLFAAHKFKTSSDYNATHSFYDEKAPLSGVVVSCAGGSNGVHSDTNAP